MICLLLVPVRCEGCARKKEQSFRLPTLAIRAVKVCGQIWKWILTPGDSLCDLRWGRFILATGEKRTRIKWNGYLDSVSVTRKFKPNLINTSLSENQVALTIHLDPARVVPLNLHWLTTDSSRLMENKRLYIAGIHYIASGRMNGTPVEE